MTLRARVVARPLHAGQLPDPFPAAPDFHQSPARLLCLGALGTDTRLVVAERAGRAEAAAVFERQEGRWFLWKGPAGEPRPEALAALLGAPGRAEAATLVLDPAWAFADVLQRAGFAPAGAFSTLLVPAGGGADAILARMRGSARRAVKHALAAGLTFAEGAAHLAGFYPVYAANMEAARSPDFARPRELQALLSLPRVHLFVALREGRVVAGSICFRHADALEARYVATDAAHRAAGPMHFVHFKTLEVAGAAGLRHLDLSGLATGEMDPKLANINRFKESFGGARHDYPVYTRG